MNSDNYCTLEMARRLQEAGIVLETESHYYKRKDGVWIKEPVHSSHPLTMYWQEQATERLPAPSMAEVWRELPEQTYLKQSKDFSIAWTYDDEDESNIIESPIMSNINPTDALCELLIWVTERKKDER